jgi:hypothetical protein
MFKILYQNGRIVPVLCCSVCGTWIDDAGLAAAVFNSPKPDSEAQVVQVVHKGSCHDIAEDRLGATGKTVGWLELEKYLGDLSHNSGVTIEKLVSLEADDREIGRL